jgi:hypothetical protein
MAAKGLRVSRIQVELQTGHAIFVNWRFAACLISDVEIE